jgi:hypothetical protein
MALVDERVQLIIPLFTIPRVAIPRNQNCASHDSAWSQLYGLRFREKVNETVELLATYLCMPLFVKHQVKSLSVMKYCKSCFNGISAECRVRPLIIETTLVNNCLFVFGFGFTGILDPG